jgi:hypothetical protein
LCIVNWGGFDPADRNSTAEQRTRRRPRRPPTGDSSDDGGIVRLLPRQLNATLHDLSAPGLVDACDTFFSHSWHADTLLEREASSLWGAEGAGTHKHQPRMWWDIVLHGPGQRFRRRRLRHPAPTTATPTAASTTAASRKASYPTTAPTRQRLRRLKVASMRLPSVRFNSVPHWKRWRKHT